MAFVRQQADFQFRMLSHSQINFRFSGSTNGAREFETIQLGATNPSVLQELEKLLNQTIHARERCGARHVQGNFSVTQAFSVINYQRAQAYAAELHVIKTQMRMHGSISDNNPSALCEYSSSHLDSLTGLGWPLDTEAREAITFHGLWHAYPSSAADAIAEYGFDVKLKEHGSMFGEVCCLLLCAVVCCCLLLCAAACPPLTLSACRRHAAVCSRPILQHALSSPSAHAGGMLLFAPAPSCSMPSAHPQRMPEACC
eukprot:1565020-Rhodomonas_salina.1